MTFVTIKDLDNKNLLGYDIHIPYGTEVEMKGNFLYYEGVPFCTKNSTVARNNFTWNGDGNWKARKDFEEVIVRGYRVVTWQEEVPTDTGYVVITCSGRFTPKEKEYIMTTFPQFIESEDGMIFSKDFYIGSDINQVRKLAMYLSR